MDGCVTVFQERHGSDGSDLILLFPKGVGERGATSDSELFLGSAVRGIRFLLHPIRRQDCSLPSALIPSVMRTILSLERFA